MTRVIVTKISAQAISPSPARSPDRWVGTGPEIMPVLVPEHVMPYALR